MKPPPPDPISLPVAEASPVNLPNALTVLRLALVPVFGWLLLSAPQTDGKRWAALVVFVLAAASDLVDGEIARRQGQVTTFGKVADPIADKALMGTALVGLSVLGDLPWWVTVVILVREIAVTLLRFWVIRYGVISASRGGKLKTLLQGVAISLYIAPVTGVWLDLRWWVMLAAVAVTLVTGLDYLVKAMQVRAAGLAREGA